MVIGKIAKQGEALLAEIAAAETAEGQGAFWWMGQHTFLIKAGGNVFAIDPFFADWEARQVPPLLTCEQQRGVQFALVSHGHGDHLCPDSLRGVALASPDARFFCPKTEAQRLLTEAHLPASRLFPMNAGDVWERDGVRITAVKSKHETFDEDPLLGFPYLGYVVETGGVVFYHSGDTINYEGLLTTLRQWPHFHTMFLPINGRDAERFLRNCIGNFTYQEAAELAGELKAGLVVPTHYDMFIGNQEDPAKFVRFLEAKYPGVRSWVGDYGAKVLF